MSNLILRPPKRDELPQLAYLQNAANARSAFHIRVAPGKATNPQGYYYLTLTRMRTRLVSPDYRFIVAEDKETGEILGVSTWCAQGSSALSKRWRDDAAWWWPLERQLLGLESLWTKYVTDDITDWTFLDSVVDVVHRMEQTTPPCLHLWLLVVHPKAQGKGVGKALMEWGKRLASEEELPIVLESNIEAPGFYEKNGMRRMADAVILEGGKGEMRMPCFAWEGHGEGLLVESDEEKWTWKKARIGDGAVNKELKT